jgi:hypothetical protein
MKLEVKHEDNDLSISGDRRTLTALMEIMRIAMSNTRRVAYGSIDDEVEGQVGSVKVKVL